jgi:hypothetical protein
VGQAATYVDVLFALHRRLGDDVVDFHMSRRSGRRHAGTQGNHLGLTCDARGGRLKQTDRPRGACKWTGSLVSSCTAPARDGGSPLIISRSDIG